MKKKVLLMAALGFAFIGGSHEALAVSQETEILMQLLQAKGVISAADAQDFKKTIDEKMAHSEGKDSSSHRHSVQSLAKRIEKLEKPAGEGLSLGTDRVKLSGFVEVEATAGREDIDGGADTNNSDITLATAELDFDAAINKYVNGHLALLYEEGEESGHVKIDEGIISFNSPNHPIYVNAGKMYVPFGHFETHLVTNPLTLDMGETNDSAVLLGYRNDILDVNIGAFNGAINEAGKDDQVNSFVGSAVYTMPENTVAGLAFTSGISYLSNLATTDGMQDLEAPAGAGDGEISHLVDGFSAFAHCEYQDKYFFDAEYLTALDDFNLGDMTFVDANNRRPASWNLEAAAAIMPKFEAALRYGGSDEMGTEMAEDMYGAALLYDVFDSTALTLEYLDQEFSNKDSQQVTLQLAVEFE